MCPGNLLGWICRHPDRVYQMTVLWYTWIRVVNGLLDGMQVLVVNGTYNFSEPLVDWTWYYVPEDSYRPMRHHRLEDLIADSFYELQVIAINRLGRSDVDTQFIFHTAADGLLLCLYL